jgi:hypothetical protein
MYVFVRSIDGTDQCKANTLAVGGIKGPAYALIVWLDKW